MSDSDKLKEVREVLKDPFADYATLKDRERKALRLVAEGRASRELAVEMDVSIRTAYNIVDRGLVKLSRKEGRTIRRDDLTALMFDRLRKAVRNGRRK